MPSHRQTRSVASGAREVNKRASSQAPAQHRLPTHQAADASTVSKKRKRDDDSEVSFMTIFSACHKRPRTSDVDKLSAFFEAIRYPPAEAKDLIAAGLVPPELKGMAGCKEIFDDLQIFFDSCPSKMVSFLAWKLASANAEAWKTLTWQTCSRLPPNANNPFSSWMFCYLHYSFFI